MNEKVRDRLDWLDSLRGIAALGVALAHLLGYYTYHLKIMDDPAGTVVSALVLDYLDLGKFGVVLFFCISGFLIPSSLKGGTSYFLKDFAVGRFFRLYPLYWLSIPAGLMLTWPGSESFSPLTIAANFTMVQNLFGQPHVIGVYWTLQIELVFYVGCAAIALAGLIRNPWAFLASSVACTLAAAVASYLRWSLDVKLPVAVPLGLALMYWATLHKMAILDRDRLASTLSIIAILAFLAVFPLVAYWAYGRDYGFGETWYRYAISYGVAITVFYLCTAKIRIRSTLLYRLGSISYSVYLVHPLVFSVVQRSGLEATMLTAFGRGFAVSASLALVVLASTATHVGIERPALQVGRSVRRMMARPAYGAGASRAA